MRFGKVAVHGLALFLFLSVLVIQSANVAFSKDDEDVKTDAITRIWTIRCEDPYEAEVEAEEEAGGEEDSDSCEMFYRIDSKSSNKRIAEIVIGYAGSKKNGKIDSSEKPRGVIILPLGVILKEGVSFSVDDRLVFKSPYSYCIEGGCYSVISMPEEVVNKIRHGENASLKFKTANGNMIEVGVSLNGFEEMFKKVAKIQ